jgi:hypothetical protein
MNPRLKYTLLFITFAGLTYISTKLWALPAYGSPMNGVLVLVSLILGVISLMLFISVVNPKIHPFKSLVDFIIGSM